ncbi:MAG: hypothetical protein CTY19_01970 [Methylomonas sp.]|nr:MAG: hypothetical protein CTY19_01970 [Methylomonas sp.]
MITIYRGGPKGFEQASEFLDDVIDVLEIFDNRFYELRADIFQLVHHNAHRAMNTTRQEFFKHLRAKTKLNKSLINDLVNAALVESYLNISSDQPSVEVLLAIKNKAHKEDWGPIYSHAKMKKDAKVQELKNKEKKHTRWRRRSHITRMVTYPAPALKTVTEEISLFYKNSGKVKPKAKSVYADWDDADNETSPYPYEDDSGFIY